MLRTLWLTREGLCSPMTSGLIVAASAGIHHIGWKDGSTASSRRLHHSTDANAASTSTITTSSAETSGGGGTGDGEPQPETIPPPVELNAKPVKRLETIGLNARHRAIAEGKIPSITYESVKRKWTLQERFGQYGLASGVDPRHLWPSVEEVEEIRALQMYRKAKDAMRISAENRVNEKEKTKSRLAEIEAKFADYPRELAEFEASQAQAEEEKSEEAKVLERRVREIQEYFGYWIDPADPRFSIMLQQKEVEEKKAAKKAKKEEAARKKTAGV